MRIVVACLALPLLVGCSTEASRSDRMAGHDVPCLHHQVYNLDTSFKDAVATCGIRKPDLTGSAGLQQDALDAKIPFTIRPQADAYLKQAQLEPTTGSLIQPTKGYNKQSVIFRTTMPLSDGH